LWELRPENEALKIREAYIQSHSIEVAYNLYLRKTNIINDPPSIQLPIPSVKPKAKPKKAAVVKPVPVVVPVVVPKAKKTTVRVPRKTGMVAAVVQKEVTRNTREQAIANVVKAMKPAPMKAVVINEPQPDVRKSTRVKETIVKRRGDHVIILSK
jgi:hypothetical protein